jgi:hypothetical protein
MRCASAALSLPVIASDVRTAMTSWTARPNCQFGVWRFPAQPKKFKQRFGSQFEDHGDYTHWLIELTNNLILHRKFLIAPRGI